MNYLVPITQNYPAVLDEPHETLTDKIIAQSAQYQFPICNSRFFNLDNAHGLAYQNLQADYQKGLFLNSFFYQNSYLIASSLSHFGNYEGNIVLNTGDNIIADDESIRSFLNAGHRYQSILTRKQNEIYVAHQKSFPNEEKNNTATSSQNTNIANSPNACPVTEEESTLIRFLQIKLQVINMIIFLISSLKGLLPEFIERFIRPQTATNKVFKYVPRLIQTIKSEILMQLLHRKKELFYADNQENLQTYVKKRLVEIGLLVSLPQRIVQTSTPLEKLKNYLNPSEQFAYLFSAIYKITDGKVSALNNLCILIVKIMLGRQILKNELGINPTLTVIKTSNFTFLKEFFSAISDLTHTRNPRGKTNSFYNKIQQFNDSVAYHNGHLKMVTNLSPVHQTEIFSHKSLAELNNSCNIGQLIENDLNGNLFNVSCDNISDEKLEKIKALIKGNSIKRTSPYLGEQSLTSNAQFVHLCYPEKDVTAMISHENIPCETIELGLNIPPECGLFERGEGFNSYEICWFWTFMSIRGLNLLANKKKETAKRTSTDPFCEFMNVTVEPVTYSDQNKHEEHKNAVPFKTLGVMFNMYLEIVYGKENPNIEISTTFLAEHGYGMFKNEDGKNAAVFNDLITKHYTKDDLVGKNSGGQHILGLSIKDKKELIATYQQIANSKTRDTILTYKQFIDFLLNETKLYLD